MKQHPVNPNVCNSKTSIIRKLPIPIIWYRQYLFPCCKRYIPSVNFSVMGTMGWSVSKISLLGWNNVEKYDILLFKVIIFKGR